MKEVSPEKRIAALERLQGEAAQDRYQATLRLNAIDALLFLPADFCESDLHRILRKSKYPITIARSIELYVMMARLTHLCEPKGSATGAGCAVKLIDFENLTREGVLDLKGVAGFRLYYSLPGIINKTQKGTQVLIEASESHEINLRWHKYEYGSKFNALDFLSPEQRDLYYRAKPFFVGRKKPTLKSLAANLLKEENDERFGERSLVRYVQALRDYRFADQDIRRRFLIQTVDMFGIHNQSMRQMAADCWPQLTTAMQRAVASVLPYIYQLQLTLTIIADRLLPHASKAAKSSTSFGRG